MEPPENFFPSKPELFKLLAVIAIATSVAALCNYVVTILSRHSKPFCDTNADSQYLPSGNSSSFGPWPHFLVKHALMVQIKPLPICKF